MTQHSTTVRDSPELLPGTLYLLILRTLHAGPLHGYAVVKRVKEASKDGISIEDGSLYPALNRMLVKGWLAAEWGISKNEATMGLWKETLRRVANLGRRRRFEEELDAEVRFHIETRAEELQQSGLPRHTDHVERPSENEPARPFFGRSRWTLRTLCVAARHHPRRGTKRGVSASDTMWMIVKVSPALTQTTTKPYCVLVCDDQPDVLEALRLLLKGQGWKAVTADSPASLLRAARGGGFDLILADLNYTRDTTSGKEGMDLLASLEAQGNTAPVVVMTAWGNVDLAVEAMRRGACDFVQKPWDNNRLLATIRKQAEPERRRQSELEIAANVQQKMFPRKLLRLDSLDYAGHCVPAREVGGDYYDFLDASDRAIGFVLGDVSGKGVPAALLMANLQACFRSQTPDALQRPSEMLGMVNKHFFDSTAAERFATLFFGIYDDRTRNLRYVNCGHCPPLLLRATGEMDRLGPTATPLGAFANWKCREAETRLGVGDTLLLYSDGVTEAGIESAEEFGEDRLAHALRVNQWQPAEALVQAIVDEVADFSAGSRSDDVTVVGLRGM